ncbi:MAG: DUF4402 domain-containing protein [Porphyrobacter sp.]|nr:DUF4402 domain-containing protein [Porphyrobacter sp.]
MRYLNLFGGAAMLAAAVQAVPAAAAPGDSFQGSGTATAEVTDPATIRRVSDLRFGRFASPGAASTIRINVDGSFNATGEVASSTGMAQPASGRGPAQFIVEQAGNRGGTVYIPGTIIITNGGANMTVNSITARLVVTSGVGRNRIYRLDLGGTLRVNANQAPGAYRGVFDVTVIYN